MARGGTLHRPTPDLTHPDVLRAVLAGVLANGDVVGHDHAGRVILAVAVEGWLFDRLAALARIWKTSSRSRTRMTTRPRTLDRSAIKGCLALSRCAVARPDRQP